MILGITGISGSGKHTAAQFFEKKGWIILDVDTIAHKLYRPYTSVWKAVVKEFGETILNQDDVINRERLSKIVFNVKDPEVSKEKLAKLNQLMHPVVRRKIKDKIHRHFRRQSDIVVVASLWSEMGMKDYCEKMLLMSAKPGTRLARIIKRDGLSADTYQMRISNQKEPLNPDFKLENNESIEALNSRLSQLLLEISG